MKERNSLHPSWDENMMLERKHQKLKPSEEPSQPASGSNPDMPPLEDADQPKKKFKFRKSDSKHSSKK